MVGFICLLIGAIIGGVIMFLVIHNNPKYINVDKMAKGKFQALADKVKAKI